MKKVLIIILVLTFNSCHLIGKGSGIKFDIKNASDDVIKNIIFTTSENLSVIKFEKIESDQNVSDYLSMADNKEDGSYLLEFTTVNGEVVSKKFGYYTNGGSLNSLVEFEIKNDTIIHKFDGSWN